MSERGPDLRLDHVDAAGAQSFNAVVDVDHAFALGHVQHDVQHDVAAGASGPHAAERGNSVSFYTFTALNVRSRVVNTLMEAMCLCGPCYVEELCTATLGV